MAVGPPVQDLILPDPLTQNKGPSLTSVLKVFPVVWTQETGLKSYILGQGYIILYFANCFEQLLFYKIFPLSAPWTLSRNKV